MDPSFLFTRANLNTPNAASTDSLWENIEKEETLSTSIKSPDNSICFFHCCLFCWDFLWSWQMTGKYSSHVGLFSNSRHCSTTWTVNSPYSKVFQDWKMLTTATWGHNPFTPHFNHAYRFQVLLKNTPKSSLVSELSLTLPPSSGMPYHKQSGKQIPLRRSTDI